MTATKTNLKFSKNSWTVGYLKSNPPALASKHKVVWSVAVDEFLRRENFDFKKISLQKPLELSGKDFAKITRIFNTLLGKRNPPQPKPEVVSKQKSA